MNKVVLMGRLTKDVEIRYTQGNNTAVCGFTLAVNRRFKIEGQPEADFIPIVAWSKTAEFCSKYFSKGQQVCVVGSIQTRTWIDTEDKKHYVTEVVADEVYFADSKKDGQPQQEAQTQQQQQQTPPQQQYTPPQAPPKNPPPKPQDNKPPIWMQKQGGQI